MKKRRVVLYGAGASARLLLQSHYRIFPEESLEYIIDVNDKLDGTYCAVEGKAKVKVISLKHFCEIWGEKVRQFTFLLTPYYSLFFIKYLDQIKELDQVEAYVNAFIVEKKTPQDFRLRKTDSPLIPRTIHYFWVGNSEMPEEYQRNIDSWRKFCPGYEIIEWNESNYDFSRYKYAQQALENGYYMYATDVARKDVLYTYGGIYFDTDVELLSPIDDLLYNEAFIGIDDGGQVNSGSGFGSTKHNGMMREMLGVYENMDFVREDGGFNLYYNTFYETKILIEKGFRIENQYQKIDSVSCFPREVLMPEGVVGLHSNYTPRTKANHKINPYDRAEIVAVRDRLYNGV